MHQIGGTQQKPLIKQEGFLITKMKVDTKRAKTMRQRLGEASDLIESDQYLPMYRNRQMHYPELFEFSIKLAKRGDKKNAAHYFASLWGGKNLAKSIEWLGKLMNIAKSKAAEMIRETKQRWEDSRAERERRKNADNLARLDKLKAGVFRPGISPLRS